MKKLLLLTAMTLMYSFTFSQISISETHTNVSCFGNNNGAINISVTGGTGSYTYTWTPSLPGSNNIYGIPAGTYSCVVEDAATATNSIVVTINEPSALVTSISSQTNALCFGACDGAFNISASGGTPVYTYVTSFGSVVPINSNVCAGLHSYTVTDANGCLSSGTVSVTQPPVLNAAINKMNAYCFGTNTGSLQVVANGGVSPYTYLWPALSSTLASVINVSAGIYSVTVTDFNGCTTIQSTTINQPTQLNITMSYTNASCGMCNGNITAIAGGGSAPYTYVWLPNGNTTPFSNGLCAGNYTLQITDMQGCSKTATLSLGTTGAGALTGVTTTLTPIDETCSNSGDGSIDLTLGGSNPGPFTYQWSNGASSQDIFNVQAGSYDVTVYDSGMNCLILSSNVGVIGTNCGSISGHVFIDNNSDCINNSGDNDFQSAMVIANPGNRYGYTDASGNYTINNLMYGTYTISLNGGSSLYVPTCTTSIVSVISPGTPNSLNNDFSGGFNSTSQPDMRVYAGSNNIAPGFLGTSYYYLNNMNNVNGTGLLKVTLPSTFISAISNVTPGGYSISGDTIIWNFNNITYASGSIPFSIEFTVPLTTPLGSNFTTCIYAQPNITDFDYANNNTCYSRIVTGSFDPNDKTVSPAGQGITGDIPFITTDLTYLIRFQNTGNGPAVNIVVKDTISPNVDITTFEMLSASHNYNIDILPGNVLRWKFNNIMLADSGSNEPASHGYIQYKIKRAPVYQPGTQIKNTAYIYFDFNEPVVTNTAINTIAYITSVQSLNTSDDQWLVYPNPSTGLLNLINNNIAADTKLKIEVVNSFGQIVYEETASANHKILDMSKFSNGVYFVKIVSDKQSCIKRVVLSK